MTDAAIGIGQLGDDGFSRVRTTPMVLSEEVEMDRLSDKFQLHNQTLTVDLRFLPEVTARGLCHESCFRCVSCKKILKEEYVMLDPVRDLDGL